jgi:hypothetical protein
MRKELVHGRRRISLFKFMGLKRGGVYRKT